MHSKWLQTVSLLGCLVTSATAQDGEVELLVNGDFSAGNTGFSSEYSYKPGTNTAAAQYTVLSNASTWNGWFSGKDHTTGSGLFMAVNGASNAQTVVWSQQVAVSPNSAYQVEYWFSKIDIPTNGIAKLELSVNGNPVGSVVSASSKSWKKFSASWNSGPDTEALIELRNKSTASSGNDFGLDDLSLSGPAPSPIWIDLGFALPGTSGAPLLTGSGPLTPGSSNSVDLSNALPGASAHLVLGFTAINAPFKDGTLVPNAAWVDEAGQLVEGSGSLSLSVTWPIGIPAGIPVFAQYWIKDPGGPGLSVWAASNGLQGVAQ